jgi:hypothetical protein
MPLLRGGGESDSVFKEETLISTPFSIGVIQMATLRSEYGFDQFDTVLQKFAHEIAVEAVTSLSTEHGRIDFRHHGLAYIETDKYIIRFSPSRISFSRQEQKDYFAFEIEEKLYATSNHRTKISYTVSVGGHWEKDKGYVEDDNRKTKEKKRGEEILSFINELMTENNMKPVPRYSLRTGPD